MSTTLESLLALLAVGLFIGAIVLVTLYSFARTERHNRRRDASLKKLLGKEIEVFRGFPIDQDAEEIVQGALRRTIQHYQELIVGKEWLYIQLNDPNIPIPQNYELTAHPVGGVFAVELSEFTPLIVVRNARHRSFYIRYLQDGLKDGELVWCEGVFDKDHNILNEPGSQLDTLSILSPEVLQALVDAPGKADIILKRNQLYYFLPGDQPAEKVIPALRKHSAVLKRELEDNLARWARGSSNSAKLQAIKDSELAVTLREQYERDGSR